MVTLLAGTLLPPLDFFIVNLAIPSIQDDLGGGDTLGRQIVASYAATYAVMLTLGGRLGDLYGRRRVFLVGLVGFALASLLCGLAGDPWLLVVGRILQGLTAALMAPQSLALIRASLDGRDQTIALGFHGATFGLAAVIGQSLGGLLVTADVWGLGWRAIFFINLPVAVLGLLGSLFLHDPHTRGAEKLDMIGAVFLFAGLVGIVIPLLEGQALGWPWWCFVVLVVAGGVLHGFWRYESTFDGNRSRGRHITPLVPPRAVTAPGVRISLVAVALFYSIAAFFLVFSEHEQAVGRTPLQASLDILPLGIGFLVGPLTVPYLMRIMPRRIAALGLCLETIGFLAFAGLVAAFDQTSWAAAPLALIGFGQGLALPSLIRITVTHIPRAFAGLASGLVTATLQISAALSVAIIGGIFFTAADAYGSTPAITAVSILIAVLLFVSSLLSLRAERVPSLETSSKIVDAHGPQPSETKEAQALSQVQDQ
ncbi:MFS transporter [Streptomyces apricus]|uniref:MFS transporter n=1 Tax=Streptomyces apricus TaxID=1828112 RepID=A0A5A9ZU82_9ACTN|nr:MFS transporter [Streptomyces apricus]KAA0920552.1 MFS transporter [Streptomyces apricus]